MQVDIDTQFNTTIEKLKQGLRPLKLYSPDEGNFLKQTIESYLSEEELQESEIKKVLCLLEHGQCHGVDFSNVLSELLQKPLSSDCLIFTLSTSMKWIVEYNQKKGRPLSLDFMNIINKLLKVQDPEVREWVLLLIDSTGNQSFKFKQNVMSLKKDVSPKFFKKNNSHNKNSYELILELEKRWVELLGSFK